MSEEIDLLEILQKAAAFCDALEDVHLREEVQLPEDLTRELPRLQDRLVDGIQFLARQKNDRGLSD